MKFFATRTENCLPPAILLISSAAATAAQNCCPTNTKACSNPLLRTTLIGEKHEHLLWRCLDRQRPDFRPAFRRRITTRVCESRGFFAGAHECFKESCRPARGDGRRGVRHKHRVWQARLGAHFTGAGAES